MMDSLKIIAFCDLEFAKYMYSKLNELMKDYE